MCVWCANADVGKDNAAPMSYYDALEIARVARSELEVETRKEESADVSICLSVT